MLRQSDRGGALRLRNPAVKRPDAETLSISVVISFAVALRLDELTSLAACKPDSAIESERSRSLLARGGIARPLNSIRRLPIVVVDSRARGPSNKWKVGVSNFFRTTDIKGVEFADKFGTLSGEGLVDALVLCGEHEARLLKHLSSVGESNATDGCSSAVIGRGGGRGAGIRAQKLLRSADLFYIAQSSVTGRLS